jgi:hypothetical protein
MTKAEEQELAKIVDEYSKGDYIVGAETGKILNSGEYKDIIRLVVYHKPSQKHVVDMYRDSPSNFRRFLQDNFEKYVNTINRQIVTDSVKKGL